MAINIYHPFDGVYVAAVDPINGNLTFVSGPSATQSVPRWAVVEPSMGRFLFVYGIGPSYEPAIVAYATDLSTGAISPMPVSSASVPIANVVRMVIVAAVN